MIQYGPEEWFSGSWGAARAPGCACKTLLPVSGFGLNAAALVCIGLHTSVLIASGFTTIMRKREQM